MEINIQKQTAIAPSSFGFGMPSCGHASAMTPASSTTTSTVVRDRRANAKGDMGLAAVAYVPGTSAWSPPIC